MRRAFGRCVVLSRSHMVRRVMAFIIAIDGPAGAGKSTIARQLAQKLGFALVDTGAIYRSVAFAASERHVSPDDGESLGALARSLAIDFRFEQGVNRVRLDGVDVTDDIRTPECSRLASRVSAHPAVRDALLELQRRLGRDSLGGAVLEGRDIGTVVFPDASLKVFLTASEEVRARRRFEELCDKGNDVTFEAVLRDQRERDHEDANRAVAPLRPADDAVLYDTSGRPPEHVVEDLARLAHDRRSR